MGECKWTAYVYIYTHISFFNPRNFFFTISARNNSRLQEGAYIRFFASRPTIWYSTTLRRRCSHRQGLNIRQKNARDLFFFTRKKNKIKINTTCKYKCVKHVPDATLRYGIGASAATNVVTKVFKKIVYIKKVIIQYTEIMNCLPFVHIYYTCLEKYLTIMLDGAILCT